METFSVLLALCAGNSPVTGVFPSQRRVTRSFDVFFDLSLNKRLSKQWRGWWFETPSRPLWHQYNVNTCGCQQQWVLQISVKMTNLTDINRSRCVDLSNRSHSHMFLINHCINLSPIGSASLARSIRIRFHFRHRTGRIRSVSDHRAGRVWRSRHRSKTPNCLPGARDQVPVLFRNAIERRGASVDSTAARRSHKVHLICCDAWPIRYHYGTDDCMNMITRMTMHYFKCNRMENDKILLSHTYVTLQIGKLSFIYAFYSSLSLKQAVVWLAGANGVSAGSSLARSEGNRRQPMDLSKKTSIA